jgi:hypothetical protein
VRIKFLDVVAISAFTPTEDKGDIIKDQFCCCKLEQVYDSIPANDI